MLNSDWTIVLIVISVSVSISGSQIIRLLDRKHDADQYQTILKGVSSLCPEEHSFAHEHTPISRVSIIKELFQKLSNL